MSEIDSKIISRAELKELLTEVLSETQAPGLGPKDVLAWLRSYGKGAVIAGLVLSILVGFYFFVIRKPVYRTTAQLMIPVEVEDAGIGFSQEVHVPLIQSESFAASLIDEMDDGLKEKIESMTGVSAVESLSFGREQSMLSIQTRRNSALVGITARGKDQDLVVEVANFIANSYLTWSGERLRKMTQKRIDGLQANVNEQQQNLDNAEIELAEYLEKSGGSIAQTRMIEFFSSFSKESWSDARPSMILDQEYFSVSEKVNTEAQILKRLVLNLATLESQTKLVVETGGVELLRRAEIPDKPESPDRKISLLLVLVAFAFAFLSWIIASIVLDWFRNECGE